MPTDIPKPAALPTTTNAPTDSGSSNGGDSGITGNRTLVITLSSVLSVVGLVLIVGGFLLCQRYRRRRQSFFSRGISPIDDDEIATWKVPRDEKAGFHGGETDAEADAAFAKETFSKETGGPSHGKHASTSSVKKPPSVIVYDTVHPRGRQSTDDGIPRRSFTQHPVYGRMSTEKALPQTPIHAKAPNARAGLTDESVPGDEPFVPSPGRRPSRLSKVPPNSSRRAHGRRRSSRSSTRSFGEYGYGGSDVELSPRHSHDHIHSSRNHYGQNHSRVYSSSSIPPRLSFGDEALLNGGSPGRPLFNKDDIGRAIG
ncbi:hypothetical protein QBC35DRAFT_513210 [Podospora australis]|uniref:Uncharacterized protein n=1 Tax=Podospora australis TaxID=1536484 RepID=A0AAN7AM55_9PEZI|nr:hypothetical protein QBC35DRAFT_513210 [Podospora australis]